MKSCRILISALAKSSGNGAKSFGSRHGTKFLHTNSNRNLRIGIQGAEMFVGQPKRGVEMGPKTIRDTGVVSALQSSEFPGGSFVLLLNFEDNAMNS